MKAGHIGAVSLALCAAAGAAMFALSGGKKAEYCSLGEYHGRVAIFAPDERTLPRQITAIAVHTLPKASTPTARRSPAASPYTAARSCTRGSKILGREPFERIHLIFTAFMV